MNSRLQSLELERERLEKVLSEDANWCAFLEAQRRRAAGLPGSGVPKHVARALADNQTVFAYLKVAEEIAAEKAKANAEPAAAPSSDTQAGDATTTQPGADEPRASGPPPASLDDAPTKTDNAAFRTRVTVKTPPPLPSAPTEPAVAETSSPDPSDLRTDDGRNSAGVGSGPAVQELPPEADSLEQAEPQNPQSAGAVQAARSSASAPGGEEPDASPDDLTAIRSINRALAAKLNDLGVTSYLQIARWSQYDVQHVRETLNLDRRISQENWIEQAALLAGPEKVAQTPIAKPPASQKVAPEKPAIAESAAASPMPNASLSASPAAAGQETAEQAPVPTAPSNASETSPESQVRTQSFRVGRPPKRLPAPAARRFTYIRGVSDEIAEALRSAGVRSITEISRWTRADVRWFQAMIGEEARISRDQWIEQAQLLSNGTWTAYALRVVNGETRTLVNRPDPVQVYAPVAPAPSGAHDGAAQTTIPTPPVSHATVDETMAAPLLNEQEAAAKPDDTAEPPSSGASPVLTRRIDLGGRLRRPPPDLGMRWRLPVNLSSPARVAIPVASRSKDGPTPQDTPSPAVAPEGPIDARAASSKRPADVSPTSTEALPSQGEAQEDTQDPVTGATSEHDTVERDPPPVSTSSSIEVAPPLTPDELSEIAAEDDLDDADALTIVSKEPAPAAASPPLQENTATTVTDDARSPGDVPVDDPTFRTEAANEADPALHETELRAETPQPISPPPANDRDTPEPIADASIEWNDEEYAWGDEADVVIVSRPRDPNEADAIAPEIPDAEPPPTKAPRIGHSPELLARRMHDQRGRNDDDLGYGHDHHAGYRDSVEEATVTIIRAEASETNAASVVPTDIANDTDEKERPSVRKIGSRFLKALTGD